MRNIGFSLALAAASLAATPALAADAKLVFGDLDLSSAQGKAELDRRIDAAAQQVCAPEAITGSRIAAREPSRGCLADAREAMAAQVAAKANRQRMAGGKGTGRTADAAR